MADFWITKHIFLSGTLWLETRYLIFFALAGVGAGSYGITVLAGKAGSLKVLREGNTSLAGKPPRQVDPTTAKRKNYGRIRWFHFLIAPLFPIAFVWGLIHLAQEKWRSGLFLSGVGGVIWIIYLLLPAKP